jgi:hypothetical protein
MWANPKIPRTPCNIVLIEESLSPHRPKVPDVQLDVCSPDPDQRVQGVALAPGEPATKLVGVQVWVCPAYRAR